MREKNHACQGSGLKGDFVLCQGQPGREGERESVSNEDIMCLGQWSKLVLANERCSVAPD